MVNLINSLVPSYFFMMIMLSKKWLCISIYFGFIYIVIRGIKKTRMMTMNVQINYYCWYAVLFSFALANLEVNHYFTDNMIQMLYGGKSYSFLAYITASVMSVLWLLIAISKIVSSMALNRKILKSLKSMPFFNRTEEKRFFLKQRRQKQRNLKNPL